MVKRRKLPTRAFGTEPDVPDIPVLAEWVANNLGKSGDLISFYLDQSLSVQLSSEITIPCAGGIFYKDRIMDSLMGIDCKTVVDEIAIKTEAVVKDALGIVSQKKNIWCALPAPHALGITDLYYHDEDEWHDAIAGVYRTLMRSMRDGGIGGHVLICDTIDEVELSALSRQKVVFFARDPDREGLATLMEYQRQVAVDRHHLATVFDLTGEYEINKLIILDPDTESIALAMSEFDPDQLMAGGYCTGDCEGYWNRLVASAEYSV
jgi:hypothetical protein